LACPLAFIGQWLRSYPRLGATETPPAKSTKGQKVTSGLLASICLAPRGWRQKGQEVKKSGRDVTTLMPLKMKGTEDDFVSQ